MTFQVINNTDEVVQTIEANDIFNAVEILNASLSEEQDFSIRGDVATGDEFVVRPA
jgi:hypothetical protein